MNYDDKIFRASNSISFRDTRKREKQKDSSQLKEGFRLSSIGYLMFNNYYVNLDTCVPIPFLQMNEDFIFPAYYDQGCKISQDETLVLLGNAIVSSFSYQDIYFRNKKEQLATQRIDACKYFIDRCSVVSDFVMEDEKLIKILDLMKEEPIYYTMILTKNKEGKSPIEEAIDNNSPKIVELFLSALTDISDFKLSIALYHRFDDLFGMGVEAFRNFLRICYFQTEQMKMMKKMDTKGKEGTLRYYTPSSVLGSKFNEIFLTRKVEEIIEDVEDSEDKSSKGDEAGSEDDRDDETLISDISIPEIDNEMANAAEARLAVEKRVEVKGIEFDWVLSTNDGERFLENLSGTDNLAYFEIDLIKDIVLFQWSYFLPRIIVGLFLPFMTFFIIFILYATWILDEKHDEDEKWGDWYTADFVIGMTILAFQLFFIYIEVHQVIFHRMSYFKSFWNVLDIASIGLNITVVLLDVLDKDYRDVNAVACVAVLILWFRFFYLLRVFSETAYLISMVQAIIIEMKYFVLALLVAILAFANTFFILGRNSDGDNFAGDNIWQAFIFSYRMGLGDFDTDGFGTSDEALIWVLWFLNTLIILIILLNLVIAIMGDTFDRVQETQESTMLQEFASIMRENEFMFNRERVFDSVKYIIIVQPETAEGGVTSSWEGKLNQLKRFLEDSSARHIAHLLKMEKKLEKMIEYGLEEKLKPTEDKINQKIQTLELRLQKANKIFSQYPVKDLLEKIANLEK